MRHRTQGSPRIALGCALMAPVMVLTACGDSSHPLASEPYDAAKRVSLGGAGKVHSGSTPLDPADPLVVTADSDDDQITDVVVVDDAGRRLAGELSADGSRWRSTGALAAGAKYSVKVSTEKSGRPGRASMTFDTRAPGGKARKLGLKLGPDAGTYGVGQPVTAELSRAVSERTERRVVESALEVDSSPKVEGSWHWVDDKKLHYRPKAYWPTNARISVRSTLSGLRIRNGLYGGANKALKLRTGDRVEAVADAAKLRMTVKKNGEVLRSIPITTGKAGFRTRNGTKVVLEREPFVRMQSTSIGIGEGSADFYDLPVHWATRITWSGEYVHGAPWSSGSHGAANVSHGCTGMSTENAKWFYDTVRAGDLVTHTNTEGEDMTVFDNGFGEWNLNWEQWQKGSALHDGPTPEQDRGERERGGGEGEDPEAGTKDAKHAGSTEKNGSDLGVERDLGTASADSARLRPGL
ncbi:L,D-transpeptidase family protein [Streptomyces sp. P38-E01]|uniref:L,D-transpeptidase family protein n=1 Tax=Streptomyces tardus TaxID=2780544 RepID=A0A949N9E1_9ACTN|nr:L,D-transpeptidase family protein [Streptomyces tardus]